MTTKRPRLLVLERHGESLLNQVRADSPIFFSDEEKKNLFKDMPDHKVGLSAEGVQQAVLTGVAMHERGFRFDRVYDSGYARTVQTIDYNLEAYSETEKRVMQRKHDILLRERETGYAYSMNRDYILKTFPWYQEYWQTHGPIFARPLGGESVADVIVRVEPFLDKLFEETEGERVLLVIHGRVLSAIRYLLEGWDYTILEKFLSGHGPKNCSLTTYETSLITGEFLLKEYDTCLYQLELELASAV